MKNQHIRHFLYDPPSRATMLGMTLAALLIAVGTGLKHMYAAALTGNGGAIVTVVCVAALLLVVACGWFQRMRRNSHA